MRNAPPKVKKGHQMAAGSGSESAVFNKAVAHGETDVSCSSRLATTN